MSRVFNNYSPLVPEKELKARTFFVSLFIGIAIFLPYIIADKGYFLFYGDYSVQQIPFYKMCHEMIRNGTVSWNWETDLGVNFFGSYSFYLLGSPFFWFTLLFPTSFVPYLIAPLLIVKIALAALTAYLFIRRFTRTPAAAMLGGILYAFSGFSVYNIFFNHFHEAIVFFPLLLLSIELLITENRRGPVAISVFLCGISNYYFFFGMVIFTVIYWLVRMFSKSWKFDFRRFLVLIFECVLGVLMGAAILLTTFLALKDNSRLKEVINGWNAILYGKEQIYANIIEVFFFPPDIPARPVFFPDADVKWSSLGGWLPLFSMCGVFAFMQSKKGHWIRRVLGISIFMAMIPVLNSVFSMFNESFYTRWFYMPILIMCLATVTAVEDKEVNWRTAYRWCLFITLAFVAVIGFFPSKTKDGGWRFGLYTEGNIYPARFAVTCAFSIVSLILLRLLITQLVSDRKYFLKASICVVSIISVLYASYFISTGRTHAYDIQNTMIDSLIEGNVDLGDRTQFRIDVYDGVDNTGMYLGYDSINTFHSIVPQSITDFYEYIGEERVVGSRPTVASYPIRSLLSVKYLLCGKDSDSFEEEGRPLMPDFEFLREENGYKIYENKDFIPYGFTYDHYISYEECDTYGKEYRANMMLKGILLNSEQIEKYSDILTDLSADYNVGGNNLNGKEVDIESEGYAKDCETLRKNSCRSFSRTKNGFTADINSKKENLLFFSVPFNSGWSATVNGQPVTIEKVNVGFMAVKIPSGDSTVEFTYKTPGLELGIYISLGAFILFIGYTAFYFVLSKRHPEKFLLNFPEGDALCEKFSRYDIEEQREREQEKEITDLLDEPDDADEDAEDEFFKKIDFSKTEKDIYKGFSGGFVVNDRFLEGDDDKDKEDK